MTLQNQSFFFNFYHGIFVIKLQKYFASKLNLELTQSFTKDGLYCKPMDTKPVSETRLNTTKRKTKRTSQHNKKKNEKNETVSTQQEEKRKERNCRHNMVKIL
jgi:hypothetical protein